jgi:hypothetical protein
MLKPICVSCGTFFKPLKTGISVMEMMQKREGAVAGKVGIEDWKPYKIWQADLYMCRSCGMEIVIGAGMRPIVEHYMPEFEQELKHHPPEVTVNDC